MEEYLIAAVLISVGVYVVFLRGGAEPQPAVAPTTDDKKGSESTKEDGKEEESKEEVEEDVDPSLWPKLRPMEVSIYFGSQTGTAEKFANTLKEECRKYMGLIANVIDMEDFDIEEFKQTDLNIMAMATHGEGEPTDNALRVHAMLKKAAKNGETDKVKGMDFAVFGLGDTEYENFCSMGKFFDEKLAQLGGERAYKLGMGDASNDLDQDFANWKQDLWPALIERYQATETDDKNGAAQVEQRTKSMTSDKRIGEKAVKQPLTIRQYGKAKDVKIDSIRELKQTQNYGSCLEIIYDLQGSELSYNTAANLAVFATNRDSDVDRALAGADGNLEVTDAKYPLPCTVREAFTKYIDLTGSVDKSLVKHLLPFVKDESEKNELQNLNLIDIKAECTNVLDILDRFKSIEMTVDDKLKVFAPMMPRYYTIASSAVALPNKVRIAISLTDYETKQGRKFKGLVSEYYQKLYTEHFEGDKTGEVTSRIFFKDSLFKLPESTETPLIMVGPGTGVVPFIAFAEEREHIRQSTPDAKFGVAELYFGCKNRNDDYIYRDEIAKFNSDGVLSKVHTAFSREQEDKFYVQDIIKNQTFDQIKDLIMNQNAYFYICGAMNMGKAVETMLSEMVGEDYFKNMKETNRFAKELWSG